MVAESCRTPMARTRSASGLLVSAATAGGIAAILVGFALGRCCGRGFFDDDEIGGFPGEGWRPTAFIRARICTIAGRAVAIRAAAIPFDADGQFGGLLFQEVEPLEGADANEHADEAGLFPVHALILSAPGSVRL